MLHWIHRNHGTLEASELGLPPGVFPSSIMVDDLKLIRSGAIVRADEVLVVNYFTEDGRVVEVFND